MASFDELMLPHLPSAYNLAHWILRNQHDAEDAVQEAYLQAYRAFARFSGQNGRAWILTIVRNACYGRLRRQKGTPAIEAFDEMTHSLDALAADESVLAERIREADGAKQLELALEALPPPWREMIVLHDLEGLSYREIAVIADVPIGTVMSRLSRARARLQNDLRARLAPPKSAAEAKT